jgi:hypothetical protein
MKTLAADRAQIMAAIAKFDPVVARKIRAVRAVLQKRFPTAFELAYDNYNFFVIGYCSTERPSDCVVSIAADANGVGLSFYAVPISATRAASSPGVGNRTASCASPMGRRRSNSPVSPNSSASPKHKRRRPCGTVVRW